MNKNTFYRYHIFEKCCDYIKDDFWKDIFIQFANGKFKKGFGSFEILANSFKKKINDQR